MSIITRSKPRSEQPSDLLTSLKDGVMNHSRKIVRSQQGQAVVTRAARDGSPLTSVFVANGTQQLFYRIKMHKQKMFNLP